MTRFRDAGHDLYQLVGEIFDSTPVITSTSTQLPVAASPAEPDRHHRWPRLESPTEGSRENSGVIGGLLVYDGRLIGTSYMYFDANGDASRSHFTSDLDLERTGDFHGMYRVGTRNPGFVAGHMAHIPPEWQTALGGSLLTGLDGVPIVSRTSYGPTISVFDPAQLGVIDPVPATASCRLQYEHATLALGKRDESTEFNRRPGSREGCFPLPDRVLLIGAERASAIPCYGEGTSDPALDRTTKVPESPACGNVYDPADNTSRVPRLPICRLHWAYRVSGLGFGRRGQLQFWQGAYIRTWDTAPDRPRRPNQRWVAPLTIL